MSRGVVYSLIAVVAVLLLGIIALLGVTYSRQRRLEDSRIDLERSLSQQRAKVAELQKMLATCDSMQTILPDRSWTRLPTNSEKISQAATKK